MLSDKEDVKTKTDSEESDSSDESDESDEVSSSSSAASTSPDESSDKEDNDTGIKEEQQQTGRAKDLASFFSAQPDDQKVIQKKRFVIDQNPETIVLENEPQRLEGVIRSDDPGEWQKPIEVEKGHAKNIASRWQNRRAEPVVTKSRVKLDFQKAESGVFENEPVVLEGVVRSGERTEEVVTRKGRIRDIVDRFGNVSDDDDDDKNGSDKRRDIQRRRSDAIRRSVGAHIVSENIPAEADPNVARYDDSTRDEPVVESGRIRNIAGMWQQTCDSAPTPRSGDPSKPAWKLELEQAKEYGVFENEPEVRDDVVRADDENPDVISVQHTRSVRKMWSQIEQEEIKGKDKPILTFKKSKKDPSPEPEPEPKKEVEPIVDPRKRRIEKLRSGKMQKEPTEVATPGQTETPKPLRKTKRDKSKLLVVEETQQQVQFVKPALKHVLKKK